MHKKRWAKSAAFFMAFMLAAQPICVHAERTRAEVQQEQEQIRQQQQNTQSQYNEVQGQLGDLQEEQSAIEEEIQALDEILVEIIASVALQEEQIADTQEQIETAQADYDAAKAQEDAQYQAMKKRIRYLYEKGDTNYVELLIKATSWSAMLNQAGYVEKLYEYDARMLRKFMALKEEVAAKKSALEDVMSELESQMHELEEEKIVMEEMLAEKQAASADFDSQIARVKQEAAAYKAQIKQQNAQLAKLKEEENAIIKAEEERRRKEEEARKASEAARNSSSSSSGGLKTVPPATGNTGEDVAKYACQFVGNPYVLGGTSLTNGADCSGFVQAVYKQYGYSLPRNSSAQRSAGREVSYSEAKPGDIICYAGHVAIYLGGGRIVHASTARTGIKYGYATYRTILSVRRIM